MIKNNNWPHFLQRINLSVMIILALLILSSFIIPFSTSWKYLPVFKFQLFEEDKLLEIFAHAHMFNFNLGFFFQLFTLLFSFLIFFSNKRNIAFQMSYALVIIRSGLILMQNSTIPENYISKKGDSSVIILQSFYLLFFISLYILNKISDSKKRLPNREPYEIIKD
jgi:hypothetical protein